MKRGHKRSRYLRPRSSNHTSRKNKTRDRSPNKNKKRTFNLRKFFGIPSWIFNGIVLILLGVLLLRFSGPLFINWLNWEEGLFWGIFFGVIFILAGIFCLIAWWRNNVLQHRVGVKIGGW